MLVWDIDKTYIDTRFESMRAMMRVPFEKPHQKKVFRSVADFLREIKLGLSDDGRSPVNLTFISASPIVLQRALRARFRLDELEVDSLILKDWKRLLTTEHWMLFRNQLPYKLEHLLQLALDNPDWRFFCFGDDWEMDLVIYVLLRDILEGRIPRAAIVSILARSPMPPQERKRILHKVAAVEPAPDRVRIFLHRVKLRTFDWVHAAGEGVIPYDSYLQIAARALQENWLSEQAALRLVEAARNQWTLEEVWLELAAGVRYGTIRRDRIAVVRDFVDRYLPGLSPQLRDRLAGGAFRPDYQMPDVGEVSQENVVPLDVPTALARYEQLMNLKVKAPRIMFDWPLADDKDRM